MEITREEYLKAVQILKAYVKQQEEYFKESKNLLDKVNLFHVSGNQKIKDSKISIRLLNCLVSIDTNNRHLTVKEISEKYTKTEICKARNMGKKSLRELEDLFLMAGIINWN